MKVSIELSDDGELTIDTGDEELDIVQVNALLDIAKFHLITSLMRGIGEQTATPEDAEDEISV